MEKVINLFTFSTVVLIFLTIILAATKDLFGYTIIDIKIIGITTICCLSITAIMVVYNFLFN